MNRCRRPVKGLTAKLDLGELSVWWFAAQVLGEDRVKFGDGSQERQACFVQR